MCFVFNVYFRGTSVLSQSTESQDASTISTIKSLSQAQRLRAQENGIGLVRLEQ